MKKNMILFLDLDGVLITTPSWKTDEMDFDGYSKFALEPVQNLNTLLRTRTFEIWLSSARRITKSLEELNEIFKVRGILQPIKGLLPYLPAMENRRAEIESFIKEKDIQEYLILDDDKSLNDLPPHIKAKLILTQYLKGFNKEKLEEAIKKVN